VTWGFRGGRCEAPAGTGRRGRPTHQKADARPALEVRVVVAVPRHRRRPPHLEGDGGQASRGGAVEQAGDGGRLVRQGAGGDGRGHPGGQRLLHQAEGAGLAHQLQDARVGGAMVDGRQLEQVLGAEGVEAFQAEVGRPGDVGRPTGHRAFVVHPAGADRPPGVHLSHPVAVGHPDVGQELLAELPGPVEHLDALDLDRRLVQGKDEHRQPPVLGDVPVGPGQAQAPVGPPGSRRPDLRPVEHPFFAVAYGRGLSAGGVGTASRF
jgi:hypothetical protein